MRQPTPEEVRGLWAHMREVYDTGVHPKATAAGWGIVAELLEEAGILGADAFMRDFATTLGRDIFIPFEVGEPTERWTMWAQTLICVHEHQHVAQYLADPRATTFGYASSAAKRAHLEADAYATAIEMTWLRDGHVHRLVPQRLARSLSAYAVQAEDIDVAERELVAVARSCERGIVTRPATLTAVAWLDEHAPGVLLAQNAA